MSRSREAMVPMLNAAWQASHDPENIEEPREDLRYRYDGTFVPDPKAVGKWVVSTLVDHAAELDLKAKSPRGKTNFNDIELRSMVALDHPATSSLVIF